MKFRQRWQTVLGIKPGECLLRSYDVPRSTNAVQAGEAPAIKYTPRRELTVMQARGAVIGAGMYLREGSGRSSWFVRARAHRSYCEKAAATRLAAEEASRGAGRNFTAPHHGESK
jgi:hypothetical protein